MIKLKELVGEDNAKDAGEAEYKTKGACRICQKVGHYTHECLTKI